MSDFTPRALIVDDDELIRALAGAIVEKAGVRVSEAPDGASALALLAGGEAFALFLVDLEMPGIGGLEVVRAIRATKDTAGAFVIVLTGSGSEQDEAAARQAGADDFVRKPIVPGQLLMRIQTALRRTGS